MLVSRRGEHVHFSGRSFLQKLQRLFRSFRKNGIANPTTHPHDDTLHLYVRGNVAKAENEEIGRHIVQCGDCNHRLTTIAQLVARLDSVQPESRPQDKRSEPRFRTSDTGFLRSFSPLVADRWQVQVLDVSKNGLGLLVPVRLAKGSLVQVQIGAAFTLGEVKYCTELNEAGFHVGIRVQDTVDGEGMRRTPG